MLFITILVAILAVLLLVGFRVLAEYERGVIFRLGRFTGVKGAGSSGSSPWWTAWCVLVFGKS